MDATDLQEVASEMHLNYMLLELEFHWLYRLSVICWVFVIGSVFSGKKWTQALTDDWLLMGH